MKNNNYTFWELIDEHRIEIPIIQRDFAMGRENIRAIDIRQNFIKNIKEVLLDEEALPMHLNFVYGKIKGLSNIEQTKKNKELVSNMIDAVKSYSKNLDLNINVEIDGLDNVENSNHQTIFIPLDGQQRLTTLYLVHWYIISRIDNEKSFPLIRFSYKIRPTSKDFCEALVEKKVSIDKQKTISETIKDSPWFFSYWDKDPTVKGMLTMLDEIHKQFGSVSNDKLEECWHKLTSDDISDKYISFEFLSLDDLELTDDLYIKMNARGKTLTDYENFKAWLIDYVKENEFDITAKDWKLKLDTSWADLFWRKMDEKNFLIDEEYMRFFRNMFQIFHVNTENFDSKEGNDATILATTKGEDGEYLFVPNSFFEKINVLTENNLNEIFTVLDLLSEEDKGIEYYTEILKEVDFFNNADKDIKRSLFKAFITGSMTYPDKVRFYALMKYLLNINQSDSFSSKELFSWMRVCRNLIENTTIGSIDRFEAAIKGVDKLAEGGVDNIYSFLKNDESIFTGFDTYQVKEERAKAKLIVKNSEWEGLFLKYENHKYFRGQINFLIELAIDESGVVDKNLFMDYAEKCAIIFTKKLKNANSVSFEQALLAEKDYIISVYSNWSFVRMFGPSGKANQDWRTRIFRDSEKLDIVRNLLNKIDSEDTWESIKQFYKERVPSINDWRKYFIQCPETIKYCDQRFIRYHDEHHIRLLGSSATSHYHAELRSFWLHHELQKEENYKFSPFTRQFYHYVRTINEYPCAVIDEWHHKNNNYAIDIRFIDREYEVRFFNRKKSYIESEIVECLENEGMIESEIYNDVSYLIKIEDDDNIIAFIKRLCNTLQDL